MPDIVLGTGDLDLFFFFSGSTQIFKARLIRTQINIKLSDHNHYKGIK